MDLHFLIDFLWDFLFFLHYWPLYYLSMYSKMFNSLLYGLLHMLYFVCCSDMPALSNYLQNSLLNMHVFANQNSISLKPLMLFK